MRTIGPVPRDQGFTLIELMVVIGIIALIGQIAVTNYDVFVPQAKLSAQAKGLVSELDFLRSEARLQSKRMTLEIDLTNQRLRLVLPPEERLESTQAEREDLKMDWRYIDPAVRVTGYSVAGGQVYRNGTVEISFDENGFTADQVITMRLAAEGLQHIVWSIQIRGLTGQWEIVKDADGNEHSLEETNEFSF